MVRYFYFFIVILGLNSCKAPTENLPLDGEIFEGRDINGETRKCRENLNLICDMSFGPGDQFALDCKAQGKKAVACGCHDYICVEAPTRTGIDINGDPRSCSPVSGEILCTTEYTQEDQFADDCREDGFEVVQCGCHDYICIK